MSCNISIPLQRIIDDVAEVLAGNYISVDNPFLNESVLTDTTFRGDISVDTTARNALCAILQTCGITAIELEWLDRPTVADMVAVSEVVAGEVVVSWKDLDTLITEGIVGKVQTTDVLDSLGVSQEEINTDIRNELNALPFEDGVLADTFVVVDGTLNQRQINKGFESIADMLSIANPKDGLRVYVKSYHAGLGKGGDYFTYDSSKISVNDGGLIINGWVRDHKSVVTPEDFGAVVYDEGNPVDVSTNLHSMFDASYEHGVKWLVPANDYYIDGTMPIEIRTGGDCYGAFLLPRNNRDCWFTVERDKGNIDEVFSVDEWGSLNRNTLVTDANNCADRVVYINSSEVACVRIGYNYTYTKQERIRIDSRGRSTTPLVYTYNDKSTITVRAFQNSKPITINGFRVERVGADADYSRGGIIINRDLVTLNDPCVINDSYALQAKQGIEVTYCADVTLNRPITNNTSFSGSGYGIRCIGTIGVIIRDANIEQARHGVSGGYNVDMQIYGGVISGIDDHWGARLLVDGTTLALSDVNGAGGIAFAGNDATIRNVTQIGGTYFFGIRNDQLSCGGDVVLENIKISVRSGPTTYFYVYGLSTIADQPVPTDNMVAIPLMPENVVINNITFEGSSEGKTMHVVRIVGIPHAFRGHRNISVKNIITNGLSVGGVFKSKGIHEVEDVNGFISIENMDCNGSPALYITSASETMHPNAYTIKLKNVSNTWLRVGLSSTKRLEVNNGSISQIIKEGNSLWSGTSSMAVFKGVEFTGGNIYSYIDNAVFINCLFTGDVTQFVTTSRASFIGCAKTVTLTAIPDTIDLNYHLSPPLLAMPEPEPVPEPEPTP